MLRVLCAFFLSGILAFVLGLGTVIFVDHSLFHHSYTDLINVEVPSAPFLSLDVLSQSSIYANFSPPLLDGGSAIQSYKVGLIYYLIAFSIGLIGYMLCF